MSWPTPLPFSRPNRMRRLMSWRCNRTRAGESSCPTLGMRASKLIEANRSGAKRQAREGEDDADGCVMAWHHDP